MVPTSRIDRIAAALATIRPELVRGAVSTTTRFGREVLARLDVVRSFGNGEA